MTAASHAPDEVPAQKVFICYRREETAAHAGRLYDAMVSRFGEGNVFMDVDLAPGVDFEQRITEVVSSCVVLLVVMGPSWATATEEDGTRRIDDPADFVRLEVETGLQRPDVTPIPVLVGGARMPRRESLPSEIHPIVRRNAIEMSDGRWGYDVGRLMTTLDGLLPDDGAPAAPPPPPQTAAARLRLAIEGMLVGGATATVAGFLAYKVQTSDDQAGESRLETAWHIVAEMLRRGWTLAIVGVALASWLAYRIGRADSGRSPGQRGLRIGALAGALSGLIWGLLAFLPEEEIKFTPKSEYEFAAIAVSGGLIGYLIGTGWRPSRAGAGFACGAVAGVLFQVLVVVTHWKNNTSAGEIALSFGLGAAAIAGLTLAAMLALDRRESRRGAAGPSQAVTGSPRSG
jgi:TIR domain